MKNNKSKKEICALYKEREIIGGVYVIRNTLSNKLLLKAETDLRRSKNRFDFSQATGSCIDLKLQSDWNKQGGVQFVFEVLEELKKGKTQTDEDFKVDIEILKELWLNKMSDSDFY